MKQNLVLTNEQLNGKCQTLLQKIRNTNNILTSKMNQEQTSENVKQIEQLKGQIQQEIKSLLENVQQLQDKSKSQLQKNQIKALKEQAQSEIDRFGIIIKSIVSKQFDQKIQNVQRTATIDYSQEFSIQRQKEDSIQEIIDMEKQLQEERQAELDKIQKDVFIMNNLMSDMGDMVIKQGEMVEIISDNTEKTQNQVQAANIELTKAQQYQKSAGKKYIILALVILIIIGIILGIVFSTQ